MEEQIVTDEEALAQALAPIGKLVAVGRPGEDWSPPGAMRSYVANSEWQRFVTASMVTSRLVVIDAARGGDGFGWEVSQALSIVEPTRLLIWVRGIRRKDYRAFIDHVNSRLPLTSLPAKLKRQYSSDGGFFIFNNRWEATFIPVPGTAAHKKTKAIEAALSPVYMRAAAPNPAIHIHG